MVKQWIEKEVKFLIKESDLSSDILSRKDKIKYLQAYFLRDNNEVNDIINKLIPNLEERLDWKEIWTIRIRKEWEKYVLAVKWKRSDVWTMEIEQNITKEVFDLLLNKSNDFVEKERLIVKINEKLNAEIDFYWWRFQGVISIEVEFDDNYTEAMIEKLVISKFPWAIKAQYNCLTAWAMAWSSSLEDFTRKVKNCGVIGEIIEILKSVGG